MHARPPALERSFLDAREALQCYSIIRSGARSARGIRRNGSGSRETVRAVMKAPMSEPPAMSASTPQSPDAGIPSELLSGDAQPERPAPAPSRELPSSPHSHAPLPAADGGLMLIGVGEALGRLVGTVRPADNIHILRIQS